MLRKEIPKVAHLNNKKLEIFFKYKYFYKYGIY